MKRICKVLISIVLIFNLLISLTSCKTKTFEDKSKGVYGNFISAAKKEYEKTYGKKGSCRYSNVIVELMHTREEMAQANKDENILSYVVMLVYEENGKNNVQNYLCQVKKGEFEKIVKKNTLKETHYTKDAVEAADSVNKDRLKTGSIELDLKTGEIELAKAVKVGAFGIKTDIGKIKEALDDTVIGLAAGIEKTLNTIRNEEIEENKICEKLTNAAYYYAVAYFSRHIYEDKGINVTRISEEELKKYYFNNDKNEIKIYDDLINKNNWKVDSNTDEIVKRDERTNYEKYLEEKGIIKNDKNGFSNTNGNKVTFFLKYKIEIPNYYSKFFDEKNAKGYTVNLNNKNNAVLMILNDTSLGNHSSEETYVANFIIKSIGNEEKFEADDNPKIIDNDIINGKLYTMISEDYYAETMKFYDSDFDENVYLLLIEYKDGKIEYKEDFLKICNNIKRVKDDIKIDSKDEIIKNYTNITNITEYFKDKGLINIIKIPKYDASNSDDAIGRSIAKLGSIITRGVEAEKDNVYDILINENTFDGTLTYKEDDVVKIYYHDYKSNKNNGDEIIEERLVDTPDLSIGIGSENKSGKDKVVDEIEEQEEQENLDENLNELVEEYESAYDKKYIGIESNYTQDKFLITDDSILAKKCGLNNDDIITYIGSTNPYQVIEKIVDNDGNILTTEKLKEVLASDTNDVKDVKIQYVLGENESAVVYFERKKGLNTYKEYKILTFDDKYYDDVSSGIIVGADNNNWFIIRVNKDSIADNAGLKRYDTIKEIDGENVDGTGRTEVEELREKAGTNQTIVVKRQKEDSDEYEELEFTLQY